MGAGRARAGQGVGWGRGGLPQWRCGPAAAFISRRGKRPRQHRAPASPRPPFQLTDPTSLAPEQTFIHEICAGKDWTLSPAPPDLRERG